MQLSKEEWMEWATSRATLEVKKVLLERQQKIASQLGAGACLGNEVEHGVAVGRYREIDDLLRMEYSDLKEEV